ncbi:unnamed protein product [Leptidea sinapis]|uniref:unspecific monooxygenase n=1 Tax=Leptidea sinapis TaxID=189913 RepID=A0A5E4PTM7_9NEOP|nr:unnamed protein product [Leptidea sinapis]
MLIIYLFCACVFLFLVSRFKNYNYWKKRNIVQVNGVLTNFMFSNRALAEVIKDLYERYTSEKYIGIFLGSKPAVIVKDPRDIQVVTGQFESFHSRGLMTSENDVLGDNLLFMDDYRRWKLIRTKLSPVFTSMKLRNIFYIFDKCARDFVDYIQESDDFKVSPHKGIYSFTTGCITASIFGLNEKIKTMDSPFLKMIQEAVNPSLLNNTKFMIRNILPKLFKMLNLTVLGDNEEFFVGAIKKVFNARKTSSDKRYDFIETYLQLKEEGIMRDASTGYELKPTDEILAAQAYFFFVAGVDTSATAIHFTLMELACNQHILIKLHNEIDTVFEECHDNLTPDDVDKLKYMDKVINEALRKYPPIGMMQRRCTKDAILPAGNLVIKKDEIVIVPILALHRNPQYFPNPDEFDPERFDKENVGSIESSCYLPFGMGNRVCLGARFARLQMKCCLAWILRKYTLKYNKWKPHFEPSPFAVRDTKAKFELIPRKL